MSDDFESYSHLANPNAVDAVARSRSLTLVPGDSNIEEQLLHEVIEFARHRLSFLTREPVAFMARVNKKNV